MYRFGVKTKLNCERVRMLPTPSLDYLSQELNAWFNCHFVQDKFTKHLANWTRIFLRFVKLQPFIKITVNTLKVAAATGFGSTKICR